MNTISMQLVNRFINTVVTMLQLAPLTTGKSDDQQTGHD